MSYVVLARKLRPQTFDEVIGQEHVTRTLKNAIEQGRVAHAFLFSGPRGVGKTSVARILAKALNCSAGPTPSPCNACQSCQEITQGHSLDVLEIDGASNRGIDEVRELRENIKYLPAQGRYKVYIIDEVHMLTKEAFNALLKTLEEPPVHAVFVMATTEPHKVPVTILSRCQRYDFKRLPTTTIRAYLEKMATEQGWQLAAEGLELIAREAEGGLRDALGLLDQVVTFGGTQLSGAEMAKILGVTDRALLLRAVEGIIHRDGPGLLQVVDELNGLGLDLKRFYHDLLFICRHLLLSSFGEGARGLAEIADQEWNQLAALAAEAPAAHLYNLLTLLLKGDEELRRSALPRLTLELLLLRLVAVEPLIELEDWLERLTALESRMALAPGGAAPRPEPASPAPMTQEPRPDKGVTAPPSPPEAEASPQVTDPGPGADLQSRWQAFLEHLKVQGNGPLYGKLHYSRVLRQEDHRLIVDPGQSWKMVQERHRQQIRELAREFFGSELEVVFEKPQADTGRGRRAAARGAAPADITQQALEIFGGQWLPDTMTPVVQKEDDT